MELLGGRAGARRQCDSGRGSRVSRPATASRAGRPSCSTRSTASQIGMSMPWRAASARTAARRGHALGDVAELRQDPASGSPRASAKPDAPVARQVAGAGEHEVAQARRGPSASRAGRPCAAASRPVSASPRVISAARALWPKPRPSLAPAAIASTFLTAPPISTPAMSSLSYARSVLAAQQRAATSARERRVGRRDGDRGRQAARDFLGEARSGDDADRRAASAAPATGARAPRRRELRVGVTTRNPFDSQTSGARAPAAASVSATSGSAATGVATTTSDARAAVAQRRVTASAPAAGCPAGSGVLARRGDRPPPGRRRAPSRVTRTSGRRARCAASAVPQAPAPTRWTSRSTAFSAGAMARRAGRR